MDDGSKPAPSGKHVDVAKLVTMIEEKSNSLQEFDGNVNCLIYRNDLSSLKKVGPLVPPKPQKSANIPEIPQSSLVKVACEPLYAQRLHSLDVCNYNKIGEILKQPLLPNNQSSYPLVACDSSLNSSSCIVHHKVALDNPAVLEQQLEALEHHKKQLDLRKNLNPNSSNSIKSISLRLNAPKLTSSSLLTKLDFIPNSFLASANVAYENTVYSNVALTSDTPSTCSTTKCNRYGNIIISSLKDTNNIYSNATFDKNKLIQPTRIEEKQEAALSAAPILKKNFKTPPTNGDNYMYCIHNSYLIPEDEIQPPPSPVSSSYSELQRAAEAYKINKSVPKNPSIVTPTNQVGINNSNVSYDIPYECKIPQASNDMRQYINKAIYTANNAFSYYNSRQEKVNCNLSDYYGYGGFSQNSSTYESIYEPINPRIPSQMSTRSHSMMYPTCTKNLNTLAMSEFCGSNLSTLSGLSVGSSVYSNSPMYPNNTSSDGSSILISYPANKKESEVESLTDLFVKSMGTQSDLENYGTCFKCNEIVVGENSGCTAMDHIYHITCFTCSQCQINLQGKPFYVLECKPYCEFDYLQTLEKCSVCMKPILERILRATGKPYHPQCFACVVCTKSLDGIPFTVDATNQNYCIEDFHKKFAPRCCVCKEPIMPEPGEEETVRVVALDRSFHFECYKCEDCGLLLSSEAEGRGCYPLDDHVLCKSCNAKRVQMLTNRMSTTKL